MKVLCRQKSSFRDWFNHFNHSQNPLVLKKPQGAACHSEKFEEEELGTLTAHGWLQFPFSSRVWKGVRATLASPEPHLCAWRGSYVCTMGAGGLLEKTPEQKP